MLNALSRVQFGDLKLISLISEADGKHIFNDVTLT